MSYYSLEQLKGAPFAAVEESVDEATEVDEREVVEVGVMAGVEIAEVMAVEEMVVEETAETGAVVQHLHFLEIEQ